MATVAFIGGAKVSEQIEVLRHLSKKGDTILIGGCKVAAFYMAQKKSGGATVVTDTDLTAAEHLMNARGAAVVLPSDVLTAAEFSNYSPATLRDSNDVPDDGLILDLGPWSSNNYAQLISHAKRIIWNGPMGVFE